MSKTIQYKVQVDTGNSVKTLGQLESELAQINDELKGVAVGSDRFKELSTTAQQVTRDLEEANQQIEGFTADKKFQAADGAIKIAAGSLQSFVGGLGLLGIESDALGEFEQKAASAIAVGIGLKDLSEGVGQLAPLFKQSGIAAKLFGTTARTALAATGIGLLVVALGTVVAYWDDITEALGGASRESKDFLAEQEAIVAESKAQLDLLNQQDNVLKLQGKSEEEILQLKISQTDEIIAQLQLQKKAAKEVADEQIQNTGKVASFFASLGVVPGGAGVGFIGDLLGYGYDDVAEIAANGQQIQSDIEKQINEIENTRAGYILRMQKIEEDDRNKRKQNKEQEENEQKAQKEKLNAEAEKERLRKEKEAQDEIDRENKRLEAIAGILESYRQRQLDIDAETEIQKINLEEERKLAELERLSATEEQKQQIRDFYEDRRREAQEAADELKRQEDEQRSKDAIAAALAEKEGIAQIEQAKLGVLSQAGGLLNQLAGENQQLQIASVVATQAAAIGQILSSTAVSNAKAIAASPLTFGQPWVAINSISAGLGIASSIASATKAISDIKASKSKTSPSGGGNLPRGGAQNAGGANTEASGAPATRTFASTLEQQVEADEIRESRREPVKAYVISGDVSNAQEAEAKIRQRRRVGG